jgi:hypothetical protein
MSLDCRLKRQPSCERLVGYVLGLLLSAVPTLLILCVCQYGSKSLN